MDATAVRGTTRGDVVLFVAGVWETEDLLINGTWTNILVPAFQHYEMSQMRQVVRIGIAHGAHFDFATMPAMAAGAAFNRPPVPQDSPRRRVIYNHLIGEVAAAFPGRVSVIDLGGILSPHGVFRQSLDGVQVRSFDGVHTPVYAPGNVFDGNASQPAAAAFYQWLSPKIWPLIVASARDTRRSAS
jgi:hypothetical protein